MPSATRRHAPTKRGRRRPSRGISATVEHGLGLDRCQRARRLSWTSIPSEQVARAVDVADLAELLPARAWARGSPRRRSARQPDRSGLAAGDGQRDLRLLVEPPGPVCRPACGGMVCGSSEAADRRAVGQPSVSAGGTELSMAAVDVPSAPARSSECPAWNRATVGLDMAAELFGGARASVADHRSRSGSERPRGPSRSRLPHSAFRPVQRSPAATGRRVGAGAQRLDHRRRARTAPATGRRRAGMSGFDAGSISAAQLSLGPAPVVGE